MSRPKRLTTVRENKNQVTVLLESGSIENLRAAKKRTQEELRYYWDFFTELAYLRQQISNEIHAALIKTCASPFLFSNWQRSVRYKYSLHPLSSYGSKLFDGQRFNVGDVNPKLIPSFSALYIACDKDTALQETLCDHSTTKSVASKISCPTDSVYNLVH